MYTKYDLDKQQINAIKRGIGEKELAIFGDLGTGKTVVALYIIRYLLDKKLIRNALVVTTLRCVYSTWMQEAKLWKYTQNLHFTILHGPEKRGRYYDTDTDIYLVNWEGMPWLADMIRSTGYRGSPFPYDVLVLDESAKIKDHKTQRFKKWKMLQREFDYRFLLSAKPRPQGPQDFWSQFYILDGGESLGTGWTKFRNRYFESFVPHVWKPKAGAEKEIEGLVTPKVCRMIDTRMKRKAAHSKVRVELGNALMAKYREFEKEYFIKLESGEVEVFNAISLAIKLRQFIQGGMYSPKDEVTGEQKTHVIHTKKLDALEEIMELHPGQNILCPIQFRFEIRMIRQRFGDIPILAGGLGHKIASQIIDNWNAGKIPLLPCHPQTMSHGLNLQKGGHIVCWLGLTWSLDQYDQLIGRLNRRGQEETVKVIHIIANNTTDEVVLESLHSKNIGQQTFLDNLQTYWENKKGD